jgi:hypothetical protein
MVGETYNKLKVLRVIETLKQNKSYIKIVECKCECGNIITARLNNIKSGNTKSCGCYNIKLIIKRNTIHNNSIRGKRTPEYITWINMKQRCLNPKNHKYPIYGGRGIKVEDVWLGEEGFNNFVKDMGLKPDKFYSIDRINVDGNYGPTNCKWSTPKEQANNRR